MHSVKSENCSFLAFHPAQFLFFCLLITLKMEAQDNSKSLLLDASSMFQAREGVHVQYRNSGKKAVFRMAINMDYSGKSENGETKVSANLSAVSATTSRNSELQLGFRPGFQINREFEDWFIYYGADAMFNLKTNHDEMEEKITGGLGIPRTTTDIRNTSRQFGIIPIFGLGYKMNRHISVMIEGGIGFYLENTDNAQTKSFYFRTPPSSQYPDGVESLNNTEKVSGSGNGSKVSMLAADFFRAYVGYSF